MTRKSYDWFLFTALIHLDWLPGWAPMMVQALTNLSSITAIAPLKPPVQTIITGATWRQIWTAFPVNWKIANEREFVEVEAKEHLAEPQAGAPGNHLWWGADGVCFSPDPENNSLRLASNSNYETIFKNHLWWVGRWRDPENNAISRIGIGPLTKLFWGNKNYFDDRPSLGGNEATCGRKNVEQDRSNIQSDGDPDSNTRYLAYSVSSHPTICEDEQAELWWQEWLPAGNSCWSSPDCRLQIGRRGISNGNNQDYYI